MSRSHDLSRNFKRNGQPFPTLAWYNQQSQPHNIWPQDDLCAGFGISLGEYENVEGRISLLLRENDVQNNLPKQKYNIKVALKPIYAQLRQEFPFLTAEDINDGVVIPVWWKEDALRGWITTKYMKENRGWVGPAAHQADPNPPNLHDPPGPAIEPQHFNQLEELQPVCSNVNATIAPSTSRRVTDSTQGFGHFYFAPELDTDWDFRSSDNIADLMKARRSAARISGVVQSHRADHLGNKSQYGPEILLRRSNKSQATDISVLEIT